MKLSELLRNCEVLGISGNTATEIQFATNDSRRVIPGSLFVAVSGCGNDGRAYISKAIAQGACAIITETPENGETAPENGETAPEDGKTLPESVTVVTVSDSRRAAAAVADAFYGHPSGDITLVGITGTNGKTTTVTLLYRLFRSLGYECGLLSTIANYIGEERFDTENTTSDPFTINSMLRQMCARGCEYCFMEVSSIGVQQQRVSFLDFRAGIFSNLTHDHLDYHGSFAEYLRCKKMFFDSLGKSATAIINVDDKNGMIMTQNTAARVVTYSCRASADHCARIVEESFEGMLLRIDGTEVYTRLIGAHNAYNLLAIYCTALELGADLDETLLALSSLESARGRLETIRCKRGINVVIDYAHTPDALENVLKTLRDVAPENELVCLFGCGGDRDRTKRPEMAAVAEKLADRIVISSDNCRTEKPEEIIEDIKKGLSREGLSRTVCITDRREAIHAAIMMAKDNSTILLAGKGHETYQIIGKEKFHFDEREIVKEIM